MPREKDFIVSAFLMGKKVGKPGVQARACSLRTWYEAKGLEIQGHPQLLSTGGQTGIQEACHRGVGEGQHKAALLRLSMERNMG